MYSIFDATAVIVAAFFKCFSQSKISLTACRAWNEKDNQGLNNIEFQNWRVMTRKGGVSGEGRDDYYEHLLLTAPARFDGPAAFNYGVDKVRGIGLGGYGISAFLSYDRWSDSFFVDSPSQIRWVRCVSAIGFTSTLLIHIPSPSVAAY